MRFAVAAAALGLASAQSTYMWSGEMFSMGDPDAVRALLPSLPHFPHACTLAQNLLSSRRVVMARTNSSARRAVGGGDGRQGCVHTQIRLFDKILVRSCIDPVFRRRHSHRAAPPFLIDLLTCFEFTCCHPTPPSRRHTERLVVLRE
jgi:hypothetical protein